MAPVVRQVGLSFAATIPAGTLNTPGVEYGFSFHNSPQQPMAWGPNAATVMPATAVEKRPFQRRPVSDTGAGTLDVTCETGETIPFTLRWKLTPEARWFRVNYHYLMLADGMDGLFEE